MYEIERYSTYTKWMSSQEIVFCWMERAILQTINSVVCMPTSGRWVIAIIVASSVPSKCVRSTAQSFLKCKRPLTFDLQLNDKGVDMTRAGTGRYNGSVGSPDYKVRSNCVRSAGCFRQA